VDHSQETPAAHEKRVSSATYHTDEITASQVIVTRVPLGVTLKEMLILVIEKRRKRLYTVWNFNNIEIMGSVG
jgi:hypothetical protein